MFALQVIDPYVEVEVSGVSLDNRKRRTKAVDDNGKFRIVLWTKNQKGECNLRWVVA